jgi:hypothetical protein
VLAVGLAGFAFGAAPAAAQGAGRITYYVSTSGGSPTCSTAAGNTSQPFATVAAALGCARGDSTTPTAPDTIDIAAGTYNENDTISADVNLAGAGASTTILDGTLSGVVFYIPDSTVVISGVTVENGGSTNSNSTIGAAGGIFNNQGTLTVTDDVFAGNSAQFFGGGIRNDGTLTATNDTFSGNSGPAYGGGIFNDTGTATATDDTFAGNTSPNGGGIMNAGTLTATNDTFSGNSTNHGGGLYNASSSTVTASNDTFSANTATNDGGAIYNSGTVTATNDTISGNTANTAGGGVYDSDSGTTTMAATILSDDTGGDCASFAPATFTDNGYNVDDDGSCGFSSANGSLSEDTGLRLGPLQDNGGPTETMALGPASSAFELVPAASCTVATDQRGDPRPGVSGQNCDAGAYEYQGTGTGTTYFVTSVTVAPPSCASAANDASSPFTTVAAALSCAAGDSTSPSAPDTIEVGGGTYAEIDTIAADVNIVGAGAQSTIVDGSNSGTVITIDNPYTVGLSGLTVQDGANSFGGGLNNSGTATLTDVTVSGNSATGGAGGGVYNAGSLTASDDTFTGNNATGGFGGAIDNGSVLTAIDDTFAGNGANRGFGGAIVNGGILTAKDDTFSSNTASSGGGIYNSDTATFTDSVLADNTGGACAGTITDGGQNVDDDGSCGFSGANGSLSDNSSIGLGPLQYNGGQTETMAIGVSSSAFGLVPAASCTAVATDQRGDPRPGVAGQNCDAGAYEYQGAAVTFEPNGGSGTMSIEIANSPTALTAEAFSYSGHIFTGWNTSADGSGASYPNGAIYEFVANSTLYAQWIPVYATTTGVTDDGPAAPGTSLTFTATVTGAGPMPTGAITWTLSGPGSPTCSQSTLDGSGAASCTVSAAAPGTYSATAAYGGDSNNAASSGSDTSGIVNTYGSTTAVADNGPVAAGGSLTFTATVTGSGPTPTGFVAWALSGHDSPACSLSHLDGSGKATCTVSPAAPGTYSATADYGGDSNYATSSGSDNTGKVNTYSSSTAVTDSGPVAAGGHLTFTATVGGSGPTATGTVTWALTGTGSTCAKSSLAGSGKATCTISVSAPGTYGATASYGGDSNYATSSGSDATAQVKAANGTGTIVVTPGVVDAKSAKNTLTFKYTAAAGGVAGGEVSLSVPAGWSLPSTIAHAAGYVTSTCGHIAVAGTAFTVSGVTLAAGKSCTIVYGSRAGAGPGATASSATGSETFVTKESSVLSGTLTALARPAKITVYAANGSGTMTVSPTTVHASSKGNTLTFTYTAATGGLAGGQLNIVVPAGWSAPSTSAKAAGLVIATCGTVVVSKMTVEIKGVTLGSARACKIAYGSRAHSGPGATAPSATGTDAFIASEASSSPATLGALASSPKVKVTPKVSDVQHVQGAHGSPLGWFVEWL